MKNWKEIYFKDFIALQRGYDLFKNEYQEGEYPVIGATEIAGYHSSFKVIGPGITVGRVGSIGNVQLIQKNYWPHQDCLFVKDFKGNDLKFVYYCLKALPLSHLDAGGAVPALNRNHLDYIKINLPPHPAQQHIASVLSAYDELIEVNNQRIKLLEETARELYKEWFVRMRFPGYKLAKFVKGVPEGWKVDRIGSVIKIKNGKECELTENGIHKVYGSNGQIGFSNKYNYEKVLIIGRVGAYCGSIEIGDGKIWATDNTLVAIPALECAGFYFSYYLLKILDLGNFAGGSAQPLLTQSIINRLKIEIPKKELIKKYELFASPIFDQMEILQQQNTQLRQIRDRLLPRLISGKLEVKTGEVLLNSETETKYN